MVGTRVGRTEETTVVPELASERAGANEQATRWALARIGGVAALLGAAVFFVSGLLHPSHSDPNDLPAAFAEYVKSPDWVGIHLAQLAGVVLIAVALVALEATSSPAGRRPGPVSGRPGRQSARRSTRRIRGWTG